MITPEATITYPALFEPKENLSGHLKYSCSLLIPKSDKKGIAKLEAAIEKAKQKGKTAKWNNKIPHFNYEPLRDGDKELENGQKEGNEYKGMMFINCSANEDSPPGVVDCYGEKLLDKQAIYSGCVVRADVRPYPYKSGGNCGIAWWLNNIMLVDDGPRLDGKQNAVDAFADFTKNVEDEDSLA